jgi:cephalosporin-C deacetylase-like acetyl esterase
MAHTEKPLSFVDTSVIDSGEKLDQFDPSVHSNGAFDEFWREYKEKLRAI